MPPAAPGPEGRPGEAAPVDLFIVGGGVNGCGIARDAAGRGLSVVLAEQGDLAQATSSASTKLIHGGLRYLEYFELRLVREALAERAILLGLLPHISRPMRFVLPCDPGMRFDAETPASRLIARAMPWTRGRRPEAMIRAGLFLYDRLAGRGGLPGTRRLDLARDPAGAPLRPGLRRAFEYSDGWVDDARLVALNARDAAERGARILVRRRVTGAAREGGLWRVAVEGPAGREEIRARALVNAAGPWVEEVLRGVEGVAPAPGRLRLVRGSHLVVRRLYDHDRCYVLQGPDGRIVFVIPYQDDFTLIGTTDMDHGGPQEAARCTAEERDYLLAAVARFLARPVTAAEVVWSYAGVRPLHDDGAASASATTRDYVLALDAGGAGRAPLLSVFGGKITTYRRLAEAALARLAPHLPAARGPWTRGVPLPGGDFRREEAPALVARLRAAHPFLTEDWAARLTRAYGTEAAAAIALPGGAGPGRRFGATLTEAEARWLVMREFARSAEDILWRRTKLGLRMTPGEVAELEDFLAALPDSPP